MSVADEIQKLQDLHRSGALTDDEFAAAKARALAGQTTPSPTPDVGAHLAEIKHQNALADLDRQWALDRERYMVTGRYGHRYIPSRGMSLLGGIVIGAFGVFWTVMAASMGAPGIFPVFGLLFIFFGVGLTAFSFIKAGQYEEADQRYRRRRDALARRTESEPEA